MPSMGAIPFVLRKDVKKKAKQAPGKSHFGLFLSGCKIPISFYIAEKLSPNTSDFMVFCIKTPDMYSF